LIILNVVAVILSSFENIASSYGSQLSIFECFSVIVFSVEYILRLWTADYKYPKSKFPRIKYVISFIAIIDLLAILPFYLPLVIVVDLRYLRILRLFRLFRVLKLKRYHKSLDIMAAVFNSEKEKIFMTIFITGLLLLLASSMMYSIENAVQPDKFPNIPATLWWAVATLTTVGYGDVYPITVAGKILSGIIAILGIGLVALPSGIISSGFISAASKGKEQPDKICPHCGKEI
jgi:voltage-gated potassium channel